MIDLFCGDCLKLMPSISNGKRTIHPTQKPIALMEYLIRTYTNEGEVVLDNCMGSGTTGVAAVRCGRRFIGIEMDARYFEAAKSRIQEEEARAISMIQFTPHAERSVE